MAVISIRLNSEEERILDFLSGYYDEEKSTLIKHSLKELFDDIQDRRTIEEFEKTEGIFVSADEILKE